jgi:molecular chaperone GrpE
MQNDDTQTPGAAPEDAAGQPQHAEVEALKARVAELEANAVELREAMLRERAEIENQRRRLQRDLEQARRFANEKLLAELLPIYDGLERGLAVESGDVAAVREGISLTLKSLQKLAESNGLAVIDPLDQPFDPERHQAMSMVEAPDKAPNTVISVLQKGYLLNDRLLRPALVAVAKSAD